MCTFLILALGVLSAAMSLEARVVVPVLLSMQYEKLRDGTNTMGKSEGETKIMGCHPSMAVLVCQRSDFVQKASL